MNVHESPGTRSRKIGSLSYNHEVEFTGNKVGETEDNMWAEIKYGDKTGWVKAMFLNTERPYGADNSKVEEASKSEKFDTQKPSNASKNGKGVRYSGEEGVRFYTDATIKSENVDIIHLGEKVIYLGEKKKTDGTEWAKVSYNGNIGWVKAEYLKTDKNAAKGNASEYLTNELTETDKKAGLKVVEKDGQFYYDYTDVVMNRMKEVLPDFYARKVLSYEDYVDKFTLKVNDKYPIGSEPTVTDYYENVLGKLAFFFFQVTHGAPWDIKRDDPWRMQFGDIKMPYYGVKKEEFLFQGELITREDLGNITYGYLGSAMGLGEITLFWGAGVANNWVNAIFYGKAYDPEENYGDDPEDLDFVKKGIQMYYEDYPNAKPGINRTFP